MISFSIHNLCKEEGITEPNDFIYYFLGLHTEPQYADLLRGFPSLEEHEHLHIHKLRIPPQLVKAYFSDPYTLGGHENLDSEFARKLAKRRFDTAPDYICCDLHRSPPGAAEFAAHLMLEAEAQILDGGREDLKRATREFIRGGLDLFWFHHTSCSNPFYTLAHADFVNLEVDYDIQPLPNPYCGAAEVEEAKQVLESARKVAQAGGLANSGFTELFEFESAHILEIIETVVQGQQA